MKAGSKKTLKTKRKRKRKNKIQRSERQRKDGDRNQNRGEEKFNHLYFIVFIHYIYIIKELTIY